MISVEKNKAFITSFIVLIFVFLSFILAGPIIGRMSKKIEAYKDALVFALEKELGIIISYEKMSPSVLNSLKISNITVFDTKDDSALVQIPSIRVYFSLLSLMRGDFDSIISSITINGLHIEYDDFLDSHILENIQNAFFSNTSTEEGAEKKVFAFPFNVSCKSFSIHFKNEELAAFVYFKELTFQSNTAHTVTSYKAQGTMQLEIFKSDVSRLGKTEADFRAQGNFSSLLDSSFLQLRISKLQNELFSLQAFDLAIIHEKESLRFSLLQNAGAIALKATYTMSTKNIDASLKMLDFYPTKMIHFKENQAFFSNLNALRFSGDFSCLILNLDFSSLHYFYDAIVQVPASLFPGSLELALRGEGSLSKLFVEKLDAKGKMLDFEFAGSYIFKTMKPEGFATVHTLRLPSDNAISFELYLDATRDGFLFFIPQMEVGEKNFTALELELIPRKDSLDFLFYAYDYSHYEYMENAEISLSGSLLFEKKPFLQMNLAVSNLFLDSIFSVLEYSLSENNDVFTSLKNNFSTFLTSTEIYITTDFTQFSYNVPYAIIANTVKDKELVVFSLGGNESSLSLTQFDLLFANQSLGSTANVDFLTGFSDAFFTMSLVFNSIPYELQGGIVDKKNIHISGSYGLEAFLDLASDSFLSGSLAINAMPIAVKNSFYALSLDTDFYYNSFSDWYARIASFDLSQTGGENRLSPQIFMAGFVDTYGAAMHSVLYTDTISSLEGHLLSSWSFSEGILSRSDLHLELQDLSEQNSKKEAYSLSFALTNPSEISLSADSFFDDTYITAEIAFKNSPAERLLSQQNTANQFSADMHVLGTIKKPSISFSLYNTFLDFGGMRTELTAHCLFENGNITVPDGSIETNMFSLENIQAFFDMQTFSGSIQGNASIQNLVHEKTEKAFIIDIFSPFPQKEIKEKTFLSFLEIPETFSLNLRIPEAKKNTEGRRDDFNLSFIRSPSRFDIQGGFGPASSIISAPSIQGYYTDLGDILVLLDERLPLSLLAYGQIKENLINLTFSDLVLDASYFTWFLNFGEFKILEGFGKGNFSIGGYVQDPEFSGMVEVVDFECEVPHFIPGIIRAETGTILAEDKVIQMPQILGLTKKGSCVVDVALHFDKWDVERVEIDLETPKNEKVLVAADFGLLNIQGNASCELHLEIYQDLFSITGFIDAEDAQAKIYPAELISQTMEEPSLDIYTDLKIRVGKRSQVSLFLFRQINPIVRSLISPNTQLRFVMDSRKNLSYLEGDIVLKGGEVNIGRSFYIKEGRLSFEENQGSFDPLVNLIAEMRERDTTGDFVKITLSALNQRLSDFNYTLSSSPPKSEVEIMSLLGKTLVYDPSGSVGQDMLNVLGAGLDSFVQSTIMREAEDRLRDFFKLDILTLRMSVAQNLIKLYSEDNPEKGINPGNFLDDSSVYIGKYFGDVLYGDFLLHLSYDESKGNPNVFGSGLSFQPELGFEIEAPFATIRWGLAPDVESIKNLWVPFTSLSLSWKILF